MVKKGYTIVLVEDNIPEAELIIASLSGQFNNEFEIIHCKSISEFESIVKSIHCDVIILDLSLPDSEGIETVLRIQHIAESIPVIVLTGNDNDEMAVTSIQKGAQDYISKDQINPLGLMRIIIQSIERQKIRNAMLIHKEECLAQEKQFKKIVDSANIGIMLLDEDNTVLYCNAQSRKLLNMDGTKTSGFKLKTEISKSGTITIKGDSFNPPKVLESCIEKLDANSNQRTLYICDVTKFIASRESLIQSANNDSLTGTYNRHYFDKALSRMFEKCLKNTTLSFALCIIDCDNFKAINDTHGHDIGDELLREISTIIMNNIRPNDILARLGGDEFAIILDNIDSNIDIITLSQRLIDSFKKELKISNSLLKTSISMGIAKYNPQYENMEQLYKDADRALYMAKNNGRDRYEIFDFGMKADDIMEKSFQNRLHQAVESSEFELAHHPIMMAFTGSIAGYESLLRWPSANCELKFPGEIFNHASKNGIDSLIDDWVIVNSLRWLKKARQEYPQIPPLKININLTAKTVLEDDISERLAVKCRQHDIDNSDVNWEINHSDILKADTQNLLLTQLVKLKDKGFGIVIDNFGEVNFDQEIIAQVLPDYIEIGKPVIDKLDDKSYLGLIKSIIDYCHYLKIMVVAEGVETQYVYEKLSHMGIDYLKGQFIKQNIELCEQASLL